MQGPMQTCTETGAEAGTEEDTENGTQAGTEKGAETGAETGAEAGTDTDSCMHTHARQRFYAMHVRTLACSHAPRWIFSERST